MPDDTGTAVATLLEESAKLGLTLAPEFGERCRVYIDTLLRWAQRLSLTGATSAPTVALDHILDSLHVCSHIPPNGRVVDLGSGAGFPGIPIALARPDVSVTLVESRRKRANFLREVIRQTHLTNAEVSEMRAEELANQCGEAFDAATSRAFGSLELFFALAAPILKPGGAALAMKGPSTRDKAPQASPGWDLPRIVDYQLPSGRRLNLVVVQKQQGDK